MTVIPLRRRGESSREPTQEPDPSHYCPSTPIRGTFQCPRGLEGAMQGTLRLEHFSMGPRGAEIEGVFTGELFDGLGAHIGRGSRRHAARVHLTGPVPTTQTSSRERSSTSNAVIDPLTVDLMGFEISIPAISIPARCAMGRCSHQNNDPEIKER